MVVLSRAGLEETVKGANVQENSEKEEIEVILDRGIDLKQESWCTVEQQCIPSPKRHMTLEWNDDNDDEESDDDHETKASVRFGTFVYQIVSRQGVTVHPNVYHLGSSMDENSNNHNQNTSYFVVEDERRDDDEVTRDRYQKMASPRKKNASVVLNYAQMIQVDQVVQTSTVNKDHSNRERFSPPQATIVQNPTEIVRLAHGEGWAAAEWYGKSLLQALPVEIGLWCWYVHYNCTDGLKPTRHPMRPSMQQKLNDQNENIHLLPLQKIFCDARVVNDITGKTFYRLQTKSSLHLSGTQRKHKKPEHTTAIDQATQWHGWICDTTMEGEPTLLSEDQVEMDLESVICNRCQANLPVYAQPVDERYRKPEESSVITYILPCEMVAVRTMVWTHNNETSTEVENVEIALQNTVEDSVSKDKSHTITITKSQPSCMQLADRSGWVVVASASATEAENKTQEVPASHGNWEFRVMDEQGIRSYTHPSTKFSDEEDNTDFYPFASILQCDTRVTHPVSGRTFYRLQETRKWIPGEHESAKLEGTDVWVLGNDASHPWLAELVKTVSSPELQQEEMETQKAWNPDFVSGIAATVDGLNELDVHGPDGSRIFETVGGIRIQIFCTQRSVDTEISHRVGKLRIAHLDCTAKDLRLILQKDPMEFFSGIDTTDINGIGVKDGHTEKEDARAQSEKELHVRHELLCCDSDINALLKKRRNLVNRLANMDASRQRQLLKEIPFSIPTVCADTENMPSPKTVASPIAGDEEPTSPRFEKMSASPTAGNEEPISPRFDVEDMLPSTYDDGSASSITHEDNTRSTCTTYSRNFEDNVSGSESIESASTEGSQTYGTRTTHGSDTYFTQREVATLDSSTYSQTIYTEDYLEGSQTMSTLEEEESDDSQEHSGVGTIHKKKNSDQTSFGKSRQLSHTCGECSKAFLGKYSRDLHCRQVHRLFCPVCDKIFPSFVELAHHKREEKHM